MSNAVPQELQSILENIQSQLAGLSERSARLEKEAVPEARVTAVPAAPEPAQAPEAEQPISEEELAAISAALAAVFGVRLHVRQIRLISSRAWAQEGRVSIQASHRLHS